MVIDRLRKEDRRSNEEILNIPLKSSSLLIFNFSEPPEILPITFGKEVVNEGDFGQLVCTVIRGDEPFSITWSLQGDTVSSEPALTTSQIGARTSMLMINSVGHRHRGIYTCNVSNVAGAVTSSTELKVNGNINRKAERGNEPGSAVRYFGS